MSSDAPVVAVGAVILDRVPVPRVVLVRRARPPREHAWSLPGGRVERGESLAAALAREVLEETSLVVRVGPLVDVIELIEPAFHYVILDYVCAVTSGALLAGSDAADAEWAHVGEIERYGVTDAVKRVTLQALERAF